MSQSLNLHDRVRRLLRRARRDPTLDGAAALQVYAPVAHACAATHRGSVRPQNQDRVHVAADGRMLVVADGMGGHRAGEVASGLAMEVLLEHVAAAGLDAGTPGTDVLLEAFHAANDQVLQASYERLECRGMGTTLIAALVLGDDLHVCHVGDVRGYVLPAGGGLDQLTEDHSVVGHLVRAGKLTPAQAMIHPQRNEILRAVGVDASIEPDLASRPLLPGDRVLLCSDGLWSVVSDAEITRALRADGPLPAIAERLIALANAAGGPDNVSVAIHVHAEPSLR